MDLPLDIEIQTKLTPKEIQYLFYNCIIRVHWSYPHQLTWLIIAFAANASGKTSGSFSASLRIISSTLQSKCDIYIIYLETSYRNDISKQQLEMIMQSKEVCPHSKATILLYAIIDNHFTFELCPSKHLQVYLLQPD